MIQSRYKYEFRVFRSDYNLNYDIASIYKDHEGQVFMAQPVEYKELPKGRLCNDNMLQLDADAASNLMDQLWIAGIRPSKRIVEPQNTDHLNNEINWHRDVIDHLIKRKP